jgi:wobble nucleotide-excising tRNase
MITSLTIKNVASYDAVNGVKIDGLKTVNFFFGFNGSGKSTIAKYIRNLSLDTTVQNPHFNSCANVGHDNSLHQIITFNEDFIEDNFKKSPEFKGVFSLNQTNVLIDQQINDEENNIEDYSSEITKYKKKQKSIETDKKAKHETLLTHCWNQRTPFATFSKINLSHSGSKPNNLSEIRRILQIPLPTASSLVKLKEGYQNLYEKDLKELSVSVDVKNYFTIRKLEVRLNYLLESIIVGNESVDIAGLIKQLNSRKWVEEGVKFLDTSDTTCPFCQKETIDFDLKNQFETYFDESYKKSIADIEELKTLYTNSTNTFLANLKIIQDDFNPDNIVSDLLIDLAAMFNSNIKTIRYKIENSNEKKFIESINKKKSQLSVVKNEIEASNNNFKESDKTKKH